LSAPEQDPIEPADAQPESDDAAAERELVEVAGTAFHEIAAAGQGQDFIDLLGIYLRREITPATYAEMLDATRYFADAEAMAVVMALSQERPRERQKEISKLGWSAEATQLINRVVGLYGEELHHAWNLEPRSRRANDWMRIDTEVVTRESETEPFLVLVEIIKRNRDVIELESPPNSVLRLARRLVKAVLPVNDPDAFEIDVVRDIKRDLDELDALFEDDGDQQTADDGGESSRSA
jgi:hypothetical protein